MAFYEMGYCPLTTAELEASKQVGEFDLNDMSHYKPREAKEIQSPLFASAHAHIAIGLMEWYESKMPDEPLMM